MARVAVRKILTKIGRSALPQSLGVDDLIQQGILIYLQQVRKAWPASSPWDKLKWRVVLDDLKDYIKSEVRSSGHGRVESLTTDPATDPSNRLFWDELLTQLPQQQKALLISLFYEGHSCRQIAESYGVSEQRVGQLRDKALATLGRFVGVDYES